jgi:hypothetical protein
MRRARRRAARDRARRAGRAFAPEQAPTLARLLALLTTVADGMSEAEILRAYPDLEAEDIHEALRFAADAVRERELPLLSSR